MLMPRPRSTLPGSCSPRGSAAAPPSRSGSFTPRRFDASASCRASSNGTRTCRPSALCLGRRARPNVWPIQGSTTMLALRDLQTAFRQALLEDDKTAAAALGAEIADGELSASERLAVYRNNIFTSLTD